MITPKTPKNAKKYNCEKCDFKCSKQCDWNRHIMTAKHNMIIEGNIIIPKKMSEYICNCGKIYKHSSGLSRHKNKCKYIEQNDDVYIESNEDVDTQLPDSSLIIELLKQNNEFKQLMMDQNKQIQEQNKQIIDLTKSSVNTTNNNNITNITKNTTNNNKFNLNFFLNETCKDAINLNDFIQSIVLNVNDFINTGEVGYVKGISNIMVDRIKDMEPHIRPIHCTDLKRETVYVKDSDKWAKEDENKTHLRKAVRIVADKNQAQVHDWIKDNPNYDILDTPECDKYFEYTKASLGGYGREEDRKFENKIINNILKETVINKKMIE